MTRILYVDIETAPALFVGYGRRKLFVSPDQVIHNGFVLCYQAAWDDKRVFVESLRDKKHPLMPKDDKALVQNLANLISEADVVIGHNAIKFDLARVSARLATHNLKPFRPPHVIDTLREARKHFMFEANSLASLGQELGVGRKLHSGGYETTLACMRGDQKAWDKLLTYGKQDVVLLRDIFNRLKPWIKIHPFTEKPVCSACDGYLERRGFARTTTGVYQRYQCTKCGAWSKDTKRIKEAA